MNTSRTLAQTLRQAAAELAQATPPPDLLARIHQQLPAPPAQPLWRRWQPWVMSGAMATAAVIVGSVVLMLSTPLADPAAEPRIAAPELRLAGFVPVVPTERWLDSGPNATGQAWVVSAELRQDRLAAMGLPLDASRAGDSVRAELLMRASGEVLAVRLAP